MWLPIFERTGEDVWVLELQRTVENKSMRVSDELLPTVGLVARDVSMTTRKSSVLTYRLDRNVLSNVNEEKERPKGPDTLVLLTEKFPLNLGVRGPMDNEGPTVGNFLGSLYYTYTFTSNPY